ncbi:MAG: TetR/AcrR family transcriptional regulator [Epsilonproteobacteria bacterium]|nr:TetR/AcrR family transcriptional regulator [Campylobacterota bacterium]
MAKIVDKEQKKRDIALSCKELILKNGLHNLTVSDLAKAADIGKGTVYEYFRSKEEIVFELAKILIQEHTQELQQKIKTQTTTRAKVKVFSSFFYDANYNELREIYKQFIALALLYPQEEILAFNTESISQYYIWFVSLLEEGVTKKELKKEILLLSEGLFSVGDGFFIHSCITDTSVDLKVKQDRYIDTIFDMMEIKQ